MSHNDVSDEAAEMAAGTAERMASVPRVGPTVYVGDTHYTTCDPDGWHRDRLRSTGQVVGLSCRCSEWIGGCALARKGRR